MSGGTLIGYLTDNEPFGAGEIRVGLNVDVSRFASLHFQYYSDVALEVSFEASNDGVNWIPYAALSLLAAPSSDEHHATDVHGKWFRSVITNAGGAGSVFRQYVYGSFSEKEINVEEIIAAILNILANTTDVQILNPLPLQYAIGIGQDAGLGANSMYVNGVVGSKGAAGTNDTVYGINAQKNGSGGGNTSVGYQTLGGALGALGGVMTDNVVIGDRAGSFFESGADNVFIGNSAARIQEICSSTVCIGSGAGSNGDIGDNSVIIGNSAGTSFPGGDGSVMIGSGAGNLGTVGADSVSLGRTAYAPLANQVSIGAGCVGDNLGTDGRLAFGSAMEAPTAISAVSVEAPVGLINVDWNGTSYRLPALSATATDLLAGAPSLWLQEAANIIAPVDTGTSYDMSEGTIMNSLAINNLIAASRNTFLSIGSVAPRHNAVIACLDCNMIGFRTGGYAIIGSDSCTCETIEGNGGSFGTILSSLNSRLYLSSHQTLISCNGIDPVGDNQGTGFSTHISCAAPFTQTGGTKSHSTFLSARGVTISVGCRFQLLKGRNMTVGGNIAGNTCLCDDRASGNTVPITTDHQFQCRFNNGYNFYTTDTVPGVGVALANGANSWAPLCDVNAKENIVALDNRATLDKALLIPACNYNYIGNASEQVCYGPTAQDWHAQFGAADVQVPIVETKEVQAYDTDGVTPLYEEDGVTPITKAEEDVNGDLVYYPVLDGGGLPTYETKPAKDPLRIEEMDFLGVLLSCVTGLNDKIEALEAANIALEARVVILETP